jgi:hypothetical protein
MAKAKPQPAPLLCALLLACAPGVASAACKADGPLATARWVFEHAYFFYAQPAPDAHEYLSPALLPLVERELRCKAAGGACAFDGDPWIEAREGEMSEPVIFSLVASPAERQRVAVRYRFGDDVAKSELSLVRDPVSQCWKVDDLAGRKDSSLRRVLQQHAYRE